LKVFHGLPTDEGLSFEPNVMAIGNFDGLHLGHQKLLQNLKDDSRRFKLPTLVLTFYPHPVEVIRPSVRLARLMTTEEKLEALENFGIDQVFILKFNQALALMEASDFFHSILIRRLHARSIRVGDNFCFGRGRKGDIEVMRKLSDDAKTQLQVEPALGVDQDRVSSTRIRKLIETGKVRDAISLLGRPYELRGQVVRGDQRGAEIGFRTANLRVSHEKLLPARGVYAVYAVWQKQRFAAVVNIGCRPTFGGSDETVIEVHLLDLEATLYDEFIAIELVDFLREEHRFESVSALTEQIGKDIILARKCLKT